MTIEAAADRPAGAQSAARAAQPWTLAMPPLRAVMWAMLAYVAAHAALRLSFSEVVAVDWVAESIYAQSLALVQTPKYPPLPGWTLWCVQQVTGPGALSTLIVKYAVMWSAYVAYFFAARRVLGHAGWAAMAAFSLLLLYQVAWNAHEGVTHTQFLTLAAPLTLLAALRLGWPGRWWDYALFGAVIAFGALSKQSYFLGLGALVAAMLAQPGYRRLLADPRILITLLVALALAGPHYWFALASRFDYAEVAAQTFSGGQLSLVAQVGSGLLSAVMAPLAFLSPLLVLLILVCPRAFQPTNLRHPGEHGIAGADPVRLVRDSLIAGFVLLVLPVLFAGVSRYAERWMHPVMLTAPIYFVALLRAARVSRGQIVAVWVLIGVVTAIAFGWRVSGFVYPSPVTCGKCRLEVPFAELGEKLRGMGFEGGTIIAGDEHIGGNLRTSFPDARIFALPYPFYDPPYRDDAARQCLIVWRPEDGSPRTVIPAEARDYAGIDGLPPDARVEVFRLPYGHMFEAEDYRVARFAAVLMPGAGKCR